MKSIISLALLTIASTTSAAVLPRTGCTKCTGFTISVSGGVSGPLGQLSDGQNRVGPQYTSKNAAKYTLGCDGGIIDQNNRGCILTPPTTQFQCDQGASPTKGFAIGGDGKITYNGSDKFWACPTGDNDSWNIYTRSIQAKCVTVTLKANGCAQPPPPPPKPQGCPTEISQYNLDNFEFPHLIVPVDSKNPDKKYGTVYIPHLTPSVPVLYNFDIHPKFKGRKCSLVFAFPTTPSDTSSYKISGGYNFEVVQKQSPATTDTTYKNQSPVSKSYGNFVMKPGQTYTISTFDCPAGQRIGYGIISKDSDFEYFQDYNKPAIGLYITTC